MSIILAPLYTHPMADSDEHVTRKDEHHPRSLSLPRSLEIAERERERENEAGRGKGFLRHGAAGVNFVVVVTKERRSRKEGGG